MKSKLSFVLATAFCAVIGAGCATTEPKVVDSSQKVTTMHIDTQDFAAKGDEMIQSMLESGVLDKAAHKPAVIVVGRIKLDTTRFFDTDLLTKKIRTALNKGGKAMTDTTGGVLNEWDYTLSGKIKETVARSGDKRQSTYTIQLSLTDPKGLAIWEDEKEVTKQKTRAAVGF